MYRNFLYTLLPWCLKLLTTFRSTISTIQKSANPIFHHCFCRYIQAKIFPKHNSIMYRGYWKLARRPCILSPSLGIPVPMCLWRRRGWAALSIAAPSRRYHGWHALLYARLPCAHGRRPWHCRCVRCQRPNEANEVVCSLHFVIRDLEKE